MDKKERNIWLGNSLTSRSLKPIYRVIILSERRNILKTKGIFNQIFQWTVENVTFYIYEKITGTKVLSFKIFRMFHFQKSKETKVLELCCKENNSSEKDWSHIFRLDTVVGEMSEGKTFLFTFFLNLPKFFAALDSG